MCAKSAEILNVTAGGTYSKWYSISSYNLQYDPMHFGKRILGLCRWQICDCITFKKKKVIAGALLQCAD
jgi:hypothetical protein